MKQRIVSGIKPSGELHLGNYLGAITQWVHLQEEYELFLFVADLHAITVPQDPVELRRRTLDIAKIYLAAGIDPAKTTLFVQSHIPAHAEACWILNTIAKVGDLTKMTQFKDKSGVTDDVLILESFDEFSRMDSAQEVVEAMEKMTSIGAAKDAKFIATQTLLRFLKERYINPLNIAGVGLFDYPVLMAGDILLYDAERVPVGEDQVQHIELARTLARRFNKKFGEIFSIPQPILQKEGARIMALDNPTKKMSKSATSEYGYIALMDTPEQARKKIMRAVTDSGSDIIYTDDKPALKNLINIYSLLSGKSPADIESMYQGRGYAEFKSGLADVVGDFLTQFQARYQSLSDEQVREVLLAGATQARPRAEAKLAQIYEAVGLWHA